MGLSHAIRFLSFMAFLDLVHTTETFDSLFRKMLSLVNILNLKLQWNLYRVDTFGTDNSVRFKQVSALDSGYIYKTL